MTSAQQNIRVKVLKAMSKKQRHYKSHWSGAPGGEQTDLFKRTLLKWMLREGASENVTCNLWKKLVEILFFKENEHHSLEEDIPQDSAHYVDQHFDRKHFENNLFVFHRDRDETYLDQELEESWGLCNSSLHHQIWDGFWWHDLHIGRVKVFDWRWVETWKVSNDQV